MIKVTKEIEKRFKLMSIDSLKAIIAGFENTTNGQQIYELAVKELEIRKEQGRKMYVS